MYLGAATRYTVALDGGGQLTVLQQNADDATAVPAAGARVRLSWQRRHQQPLSRERRHERCEHRAARARIGAAPLQTRCTCIRGLLLFLLLAPPLLWLGVIYLGSLFALLLQSFFYIDEFSGMVVRQFSLVTYRQLFTLANLDIVLRTVGDGRGRHGGRGGARVPARLLHGALREHAREGAASTWG